MKLIKFPSIEQFRSVVKQVTDNSTFGGLDESGEIIRLKNVKLPSLVFKGTVKLHGTNAGINFKKSTNEYWANSRNKIITPESDNAGFASYAHGNKNFFETIFKNIINVHNIKDEDIITIFGEWCGKGIQSGVAIAELEKMFVVFGLKVNTVNKDGKEEGYWLDHSIVKENKEHKLYNINDFKSFEVTIDFNKPEESLEVLTKLTLEVEEECPVGKSFGVSGIGEGIVFESKTENGTLRFKVKGDKHGKGGKKGERKKKIATIAPEVLNSMNEFVEYAVTENRLNQGLQEVFGINGAIDRKKLGDFIKWVRKDIIKEELDTLIKNNLEINQVSGLISKKAKDWFFKQENNF